MIKNLDKAGEFNFDFKNDIFFFKVKEREYSHSIEMNNIVIDFDTEDFVTGLQIFNASEFFGIDKDLLKNVKNFSMQAKVENNTIRIRIEFNMMLRNQVRNYTPIIFERVNDKIPNSEITCTV